MPWLDVAQHGRLVIGIAGIAERADHTDVAVGEIAGVGVGRTPEQRVSVHSICRDVHALTGAERDGKIFRQAEGVADHRIELPIRNLGGVCSSWGRSVQSSSVSDASTPCALNSETIAAIECGE